ncbi:hypothetical protein Sjap_019081 [Stephania japonica]|uniref:Uncharacterized protein n=1 Tax=Stephania japonica TaxID=461633 RepID=A0AAP0F0X2_9MAGN
MAANAITGEETRYAVVTGANRGIGLEIVRQLAEAGVVVVLTARDIDKGFAAAQSLALENVVFHYLDVEAPLSVQELAQFLHSRYGRLDILVNNAGASGVVVDVERLKALNVDPKSWLSGEATDIVQQAIQQPYLEAVKCLDINYTGCKRVIEGLLPLLSLSPFGARIVNVTSLRSELKRIPNEQTRKELDDLETLTEEKIDGIVKRFLYDLKEGKLEENGWTKMLPAYSMSKQALNAYTRVLAKKYPNMYINCVHPGFVKTDLNWQTGVLTVEEGAKGPIKLALLPDGGPTGRYFDQTEMAEF